MGLLLRFALLGAFLGETVAGGPAGAPGSLEAGGSGRLAQGLSLGLWAQSAPIPQTDLPAARQNSAEAPPKNLITGAGASSEQASSRGFRPDDWWVDMVDVQGGDFLFAERYLLYVGPFRIGRYQVTQGFYAAVMGLQVPPASERDKPVVRVSWYEAVRFCNTLSALAGLDPAYRIQEDEVQLLPGAGGYRLPTELEWEYAARGGLQSRSFRFSGSNQTDSVAWYSSNAASLMVVGLKQPNEIGLYDMSGNAWDWLWDWYIPLEQAGFGSRARNAGPWRGPSGGNYRVCRGGGWNFSEVHTEITDRRPCEPRADYYVSVSFRLAQNPG